MSLESPSRLLLVIGYVWPEPRSSAAGCHMMSLIRLFSSQGWEVHYGSPASRGEHECDLESEGIRSHEIRLNCASFDTFIKELSPQVVLFDRFMMEEQFGWRVAEHCPDAMRVLDMEDMHSLRQARHEAVKSGREVRDAEVVTDSAKREVASIYRCDLTLVISEAEEEILRERYGVPAFLLSYCPFLLSAEERGRPAFRAREHFISIGNFRHAPNWDAVLQLKQVIWPRLRVRLPEAELHIYGAYPPPKAMQLHKEKEGFLVKGWTDDARAVMSEARVCLAPLRFGAGLKGKLTEAMLCGTPSVTTSIGAEGIQGGGAWPGAVEDDPEDFIQATVRLYEKEAHWGECVSRGDDLLKNRFNKEEISTRVMAEIDQVRENLQAHREKNFTGSMLQHHTMKSTQYMAQWIEAKNS